MLNNPNGWAHNAKILKPDDESRGRAIPSTYMSSPCNIENPKLKFNALNLLIACEKDLEYVQLLNQLVGIYIWFSLQYQEGCSQGGKEASKHTS